jgi:transposase
MPESRIAQSLMLPELKFIAVVSQNRHWTTLAARKLSKLEVCPRCATPSTSVYDHRTVSVKDAPIRAQMVLLKISKRRFFCKQCQKPFTEPVPGIAKGQRTTQRFKRSVLWASETFVDLEKVQRHYRVSAGYVFKTLYDQLELKRRTRIYPWPSTIGVDEHSFKRNKKLGCTEFASIIVDYTNKRVMEVAEGKTTAALSLQLGSIEGRSNVKNVCLDLCDPFKNWAREFFPQAKIIADKFHVLRLITPALIKKRYEITGTRADSRARRLLTMSSHRLDYWDRRALLDYLEKYPELNELYHWKERIHGFYRIRGFNRACIAFTHMTDAMAASTLSEIKTLRKTFLKWRNEILAYFETGLTNARTEGYNNVVSFLRHSLQNIPDT